MTTTLISGAGGFLGCHLTEQLLLAGHRVIALDNFSEQRGTMNHMCVASHLEIVRGDCRDFDLIKKLISKADVIVPLAALVGVKRCDDDFWAARSTNIKAIQSLVSLVSDEQRIIFPCTNSGYGIGTDGICTEETVIAPISLYGRTKIAAERIVMERENSISLRFATLFGMSPRMRWDLLVNSFVKRAIEDRSIVLFEPHFKRNYLHVRDAARCIALAIDGHDFVTRTNITIQRGQIYNAGLSDANLSKRELAQKIQEHVPELHILDAPTGRDPDARNYTVSNLKLEGTGWKPAYTLDDGIIELIKGVACAD